MELIEETQEAIMETGHVLKDVAWVGTYSGQIVGSIREFSRLGPIHYDPGYGRQYINPSLVVVFTDGSWLYRQEYDGAECWGFNTLPMKQLNPLKLTRQSIKEDE